MNYGDVMQLILYVTGDTHRSAEAIANVKQIKKLLGGRCEFSVIDVLEHPSLAEREKIFATPTLVKVHPPPVRRIVGDLSDQEQLLKSLDLGNGYYSVSSYTST